MVIYKGDDLFNAVVVSLGLPGVVFHITESAFNLKEVTIMTTLNSRLTSVTILLNLMNILIISYGST